MLYLQTAVFFLVVSVLSLAEAVLSGRDLDASGNYNQLNNNSELCRLNVSRPERNSSVECLRTLINDKVLYADAEPARRHSLITLALQRNDTQAAASILNERLEGANLTLLHWAVMFGKPASVRCLLKEGIDVNSKDVDGQTPLHHAAFSGNLYMVKLLLESKASLWSKSNVGLLPVDHAALYPPSSVFYRKDVFEYLKKKMGIKRPILF